jgi:peroxiredoxin family protein
VESVADSERHHLSMIAFSGTQDRLYPVGVLASGGVANDMRVDVFLTFWGLLAARKDAGEFSRLVSQDYGPAAAAFQEAAKTLPTWLDLLRNAKELGDVHVKACAMTMDLMRLKLDDLDPIVEDVVGAGEFLDSAKDGTILVF